MWNFIPQPIPLLQTPSLKKPNFFTWSPRQSIDEFNDDDICCNTVELSFLAISIKVVRLGFLEGFWGIAWRLILHPHRNLGKSKAEEWRKNLIKIKSHLSSAQTLTKQYKMKTNIATLKQCKPPSSPINKLVIRFSFLLFLPINLFDLTLN